VANDAGLEFARHELDYRREKQWKLFSWTVTILLTTIGGIVTLAGKGEFDFSFPRALLMAAALVVLAVYASKWIHENIGFEERARKKVIEFLGPSGITCEMVPKADAKPWSGYVTAIALIAIGAVVTIFSVFC